ncbi:MAG: hypothetical protein ACLQLG_00320 [Thermoguttaceae bacterium]
MDYEVQRSARRCATSGREFAPGEKFYSALVVEGAELRRYDYAAEAWQAPPPGAIGWWQSQLPDAAGKRPHGAPNDVLLQCFDELAEQPERQDMRYVVALLLVRRRVFRLEEDDRASGGEVLRLHCPRRDATYEVPVVIPDPARIDEIQQQVAKLLE